MFGIGEKPSVLWTVRSPWKFVSIAVAIERLTPAANTVTKTTSARPIISAAEVTAVRPGLRIAFSRASRPVSPRSRSSGQPATAASGLTSRGLYSEAENRIAAAPAPIRPAAWPAVSVLPKRPSRSSARPPIPSSPATTASTRPRRLRSGSAASSRAAIGVTRVARSAGVRAASIVTPTPSASATTTVRVANTRPVFGRSIPDASNSALMPAAKPSPANRPSTAPASPTRNASTSTAARICPRDAPSVRSRPNSRIRWATVIEKVLKIWKPPTTSEIPAKTSSATLRKPRSLPISSVSRWAFSVPVSTWTDGGMTRATRRFNASGDTPGSAATEIMSNSPTLPVSRCASGSVTVTELDPPDDVSPSLLIPTTRKRCSGPSPTTPIVSPIRTPSRVAFDSSIAASRLVRGGRPST